MGSTRVATIKLDILDWEMEYNTSGIRTKRVSEDKTYSYIYAGDKLMRMTVGNDTLDFSYDANGVPLTMTYNGTVYYYITNLQGDVISLELADGGSGAQYAYDAWGNIIAMSGTLAELNPLRYRGYVYDQETGLYYLQSRYYDPAIGRYLNTDNAIAGVGGPVLGYNLYSYCMNNPTTFADDSGNWPSWATKLAVAVAVVAVVTVAAAVTVATVGAGTVAAAVAIGTAKGAAIGLAVGAATGAVTGAVTNRITTGSWNGSGQAALEGAADGALSGAVSGAVTGAITAGVTSKPNAACFVAGTSVLTATGIVPIEKIKEGDQVWAWDEDTGDVSLKKVVTTYLNQTSELVHVFVKDNEIITTPSHPFYSPENGWTDACKLRAGDMLVLVNGDYVVIEKVQHEILETSINVYNFQVEDYHTYYVADSGVLVHNSCAHQTPSWKITRSEYWKAQAASGGNDTWYPVTTDNLNLMSSGKAPIGYDGKRVVLHHVSGISNNMYDFVEIGATAHHAFHKIFGFKDFIDIFLIWEEVCKLFLTMSVVKLGEKNLKKHGIQIQKLANG